jgi:hypothetical protein
MCCGPGLPGRLLAENFALREAVVSTKLGREQGLADTRVVGMYIFIDETGSFQVPPGPNQLSCVAALLWA